MSLRIRLTVVLVLLVAGAAGMVAVFSYTSTERELLAGVDASLQVRVDELVGAPGPRPPVLGGGPGTIVQRLDRRGEIAVADPELTLPVTAADVAVATGEAPASRRSTTVDGAHLRILTTPVARGALQIGRDLAEVDAALAGLRGRLLLVALIAPAVAGGVGWAVASGLTRPLGRLTAATEAVASTRGPVAPIPVDRHDEVGRLAVSFNAMLAALDASRRQQQQLVDDASHELRTPLTTLRTNIELLARRPDLPPGERQELLDAVTAELEELTTLVTELVDLASERDPEREAETVDLGELTRRVVARAVRRTGRTVDCHVEQAVMVRAPVSLLERAVSNLLDNAHKFSPAGTPIEVRVVGGEVTVVDRGRGIPPSERERVFDRFHRSAEARSLPGSGLGLAIVREVVEGLGGTVAAEQAPGGGALLRLRLPEAPDDPWS